MKWLRLVCNEFGEDYVFRLVSIGAISTVTFLLIYIICVDVYKIEPHSARFNVLFSLALSYLASYIFYIVNVFIPKTNEKYNDYTIAAEVFARIDYNFFYLKETFGLNAAKQHQELLPIFNTIHQPKYLSLFTDKTSTLPGYTDSHFLTEQNRNLINSYIAFLYTTPVAPNHYIHLNPFGLPTNAVAIHLHGVAIMLDHLLKNTSHLSLLDRLNISSMKTMVSKEISSGNEYDVLNRTMNINHAKLAIEYTNVYQQLQRIYQSDSFPVSIIKLKARLKERVHEMGKQTLKDNIHVLLTTLK